MPRPTHEQFELRLWKQIREIRILYPGNKFGWVVLQAAYACYPTYVAHHVGTDTDPTWKSSNKVQQFIVKLEEEVCGANRPLQPED